MKLNPSPFSMIKSGEKTIELRLNDEKRQKINIGDEIEFINTTDQSKRLYAQVVQLYHFASFEELYKNLPLDKCGYKAEEIFSARADDMDIYYPKEKQSVYGVLGIELKLK